MDDRCILQDYLNGPLPTLNEHKDDGPFEIRTYCSEYSDDRPALCGILERGAGDADLFFINVFDLHIWLDPHGLWKPRVVFCGWKLTMNKPTVSKCLFIHLWISAHGGSSVPSLCGTPTSLVVSEHADNKAIVSYFHGHLFCTLLYCRL